jgi:hypothetical protein
MDNLFTLYIKPYVKQLAIVVVLAAGFQGWRLYQQHLKNRETALQQENEAYKKKIADLTTELGKLAVAKKDVEQENVKLASDAAFWRKKAGDVPMPPNPPNPPTDIVTILADLKQAGVDIKPLSGTVFSTERESLPIIWTWNKQFLRVPTLEEKLSLTSIALDKTVLQVGGLEKQIVISDKMIADAEQREALRKSQEVNYKDQIKVKDKQILIAETNGWIKVGIAVPVVYGITRLIHK